MAKFLLNRIRIFAPAALWMQELSELHEPVETGGVLVGSLEQDSVHVAHVVGPGPRAHHAPARFVRDGAYAQEEIDAFHKGTEGRCDYVGEWHSHPVSAGPSLRDGESIRAIAANPRYRTPEPVLVLCVRGRNGGWELRGYSLSGPELKSVSVEVVPEPA